ncbi:brain and acute leukemia cytoplasmic protein [Esox lucius]|uniref:brain and acute leukemia cytoplasmic protein n=1 Tax=Esox lucius TaxID=8010 RepID=UPI000576E3FF|nr:brain and acute leukemia cytoplasmic protein [Esox lucius]
MGCGGSRSDTIIEPRYHESWTRETESTWLTNTDTEAALSTINSKSLEGFQKEKRMMVTTGTQCSKQTLQTVSSSGPNQQRRARWSCQDTSLPQTNNESRRKVSKEASSKEASSKEASSKEASSKEAQSVSDSLDNVPFGQSG